MHQPPTQTHTSNSYVHCPHCKLARSITATSLARSISPMAAARALVVVVVAALFFVGAASAQVDTGAAAGVPSCASKLVTCGGYLNTTAAPPASCCGPLREAAANETACMCAILTNKAALQAFGVAPEQGLLLAKRCGVTTDASACAKSAASSATATAADAAGAGTAGSTAASSASTGNAASTVAKPTASGGATHHLSLISASSLVGFSFIWWTIMAQ
uniref:Bifunctional inhibitor/plant lipid transfer protein/seed storage helical domain-containing protein n=1 Tax=Oryza punctata TaxID=4537 RepID=A0A0E0LFJ7_ORYPU